MNLVAHQLLSGDNLNCQIGNLLGETVKGKKYKDYSSEIARGIFLHREIDTYTDSHLIVKRSSSLLHKNHGKWSPIIIDVFYDYLLIKNWRLFSDIPYDDFVENFYKMINENKKEFPEKLQKLIVFITKNDWFRMYSTLEGVSRTLTGIGNRTYYINTLKDSAKELYLYEKELEKDFLEFYPQLDTHCVNWLKRN